MLSVSAIGTQYVIASPNFHRCFTPDKSGLQDFIALTSQSFYEYSLIVPNKTGLLKVVNGFQKGKLIRWIRQSCSALRPGLHPNWITIHPQHRLLWHQLMAHRLSLTKEAAMPR